MMVEWVDMILHLVTPFLPGGFLISAWNTLSSMGDIGAALAQNSIVDVTFLIGILYLLVYPLIWIVVIMQNIVIAIFTPMLILINAIFGIGNVLYGVITVFSGVFPSPWIVGLASILSIVIGLRVYSMIPVFGRK